MIKIFNFITLVLLLLWSAGCSTVNILPKDFTITDELSEKGKLVLLSSMQKRDPQNHWSQAKIMKVVVTDLWQAQSARIFTPIPDASQQLQFAFNILNDDAVAKLLSGKHAGNIFGIENGETYFITKNIRLDKDSQKVKEYLPPVRNYFFWPQMIHNYKNIAFIEKVDLGYFQYLKVFVSNGDGDPGDDQYIVWVNKQSLNIDYIEFNVRILAKSYHGVVQYGDYREVDGVKLPHQIVLLDKIGKTSTSHKLYVEIYTLQ